MKTPANEVRYGNQFLAEIKFHEVCGFCLIWRKLVPAKIISNPPIRET